METVKEKMEYLKTQVPEVDVKEGLYYCAGDEGFLCMMLGEFAKGDIIRKMKDSYEEGDWEKYRIAVHSLKSTAKSVGIPALSERALNMETAVKNKDYAYMKDNHEGLYEYSVEILKRLEKIQ